MNREQFQLIHLNSVCQTKMQNSAKAVCIEKKMDHRINSIPAPFSCQSIHSIYSMITAIQVTETRVIIFLSLSAFRLAGPLYLTSFFYIHPKNGILLVLGRPLKGPQKPGFSEKVTSDTDQNEELSFFPGKQSVLSVAQYIYYKKKKNIYKLLHFSTKFNPTHCFTNHSN